MAHLRLLGGITLEGEAGLLLRLDSRRHPLALLALLATTPSRSMNRGKLVGLLWPESSEKKARHRLNTCLYNVRRELGDEVLISTGDDLRLDTARLSCDVVDFEQAVESADHEAVVELYGGPFMDGFHLEGAAEFERIVERERTRLERAYWNALEAVAREAEGRGDVDVAAEMWRERAAEDPYDSGVAVRLVKALQAAGNPAAALHEAEAHADRLRNELGVEPDEELGVLVDRLEEGKKTPPTARDAERTEERSEGTPRTEASSREREVEPGPVRSAGGGLRARGIRAALVATALLAGVAGGWYLLEIAGAKGPHSEGNSLAVLPFETLGEESDHVAAGIHVDLLTRLSNVSDLKVVSGTTVGRYRDAALDLPAVAESLGVAWVVEGSVQRSDDRIRVNAQLIDPRTDTHLWAATYDRELTAETLFGIQGEIATAIAHALEARLTPEETQRVERAPTGDLEAYRLYARARRHMDSRQEADLRAAVEDFRRAIERDADYALAWAGLADALDILAGKGHEPAEAMREAVAAAERALELDPSLAEAHAALGHLALARREGPVAIRHLRRAVELRPSYGQAHHWLGLTWLVLGRPAEALEHLTLAVELEPTLIPARRSLAWAYLARRDFGRARAEMREARKMLDEGTLEYGKTRRDEAIVLYHDGRYPEVRRIVRDELPRLPGGDEKFEGVLVGMVDVVTGDPAGGRARLSRAIREDTPHLLKAWAYAVLGETERAIEELSHPVEQEGDLIPVLIRYAFPEELAAVREDPEYRRLLSRLNRSWGLEPDGSLPLSFLGSGR